MKPPTNKTDMNIPLLPQLPKTWLTRSRQVGTLLLGVGSLLAAAPAARAQAAATLTTLHSFSGSDGNDPQAALLQGSDGNLYGTTLRGGTGTYGTVFRISTAGAFTSLYSFTDDTDGASPRSTLVQSSDGNFYGTAAFGGSSGNGTVYRLTPAGAFTSLYSFLGENDGTTPNGLVQGSNGNFYGTTVTGGNAFLGTVFEITPAGVHTILYNFDGTDNGPDDGAEPDAALVQGSDGNFYGTTEDGTVFRVTPAGALTSFAGLPSDEPNALVQGSDGNFYGTADDGGANDHGLVFKVTPSGVVTTLYNFTNGNDGGNPQNGLVLGSDGNFYGTTSAGGTSGDGTVFQITPAGVLTTLYSFTGGSDGEKPIAGLMQAGDGNFYGTTSAGGAGGDGTVFMLSVPGLTVPLPAFFTGEAALASGVYYLAFPDSNYFGYYSFLSNPRYIYHFDLGYEYVFDAADGKAGVYFYDFKSSTFFYTSPTFPFPYLYDFTLNTVLYYYPDPSNPGHYNTNGYRFFYDFATGKIITK